MTRSTHNYCCLGFSLVEAMVAVVLLSILAIAGASYLYQSGSQINHQRTRRAVLEVLNGRIETIRSTPYTQVSNNLPQDYAAHYLTLNNTNWVYSSADPNETVTVNGLELPLTTTVQYLDLDGDTPTYDYLKIVVRGGYRLGSSDRLTLESYYAPRSF